VLQGYRLSSDPATEQDNGVNVVISSPRKRNFHSGPGSRKTTINKEDDVEPIAIVTVLALLQLFVFSFQVGKQRAKHDIKAPAITGEAEFERNFRVHQNTLEQLVVFIPALWHFGYYVHSLIGAGIGLIFIIGRIVYRNAYLNDPANRTAGFGIGALAMIVLLVGGLIGAVISWL
jgi:uncharacterized membrane protein YecN with MAPEG domain